VKFTAPGGSVTLLCEDSPRRDDGRIGIVVRDTGRGIPADQMARVFEPFVQVGRRLSGTDEGAGLGLTISRDLARAMHGDLMAESRESVGSSFTLALRSAGVAGIPVPSEPGSPLAGLHAGGATTSDGGRVAYADTDRQPLVPGPDLLAYRAPKVP
jgi:hypothetical protein